MAALALGAPEALAQESWPAKPIHFIVPFQAGSSSDTIARIVAQPLSERLGQQIVVEDRVGGSGIVGTEAVARARPDGYTIGLANTSTHAAVVALNPSLPFDPVKDFTPVALIGSAPFALMASPTVPAHTVSGLIALARAKPFGVTYASAGQGTLSHLAAALFEKMAEVQLTHVAYRGTSQSSLDLMEGRVDLLFGTIAPSLASVRAGKIQALATTGEQRNPMLPDVPTVAESGLAGYEAALWTAIVLPAGTPPGIVTRLHQEIVAAVKTPAAQAALRQQGVDAETSTPAALATRIKTDVEKWQGVVTAAGIKPQ
ncbi:MAG TPA: tripartite tricarboxylate transporter substrate binding protein [Alphaproteobacteria bacterium]